VIKSGEPVCVYGLYNKERNCITAPSRVTAGRQFSLVAGDIDQIKKNRAGTAPNFFNLTGLFSS